MKGVAGRLFLYLLTLTASAGPSGWGPCPDGAERIATSLPDRPWVCAMKSGPDEGESCPSGTREVRALSAARPFRCAIDGEDPSPPAGACPPGQRTVFDGLGETRCTTSGAPPAISRPIGPHCPNGLVASFEGPSRRMRCVPERKADPDKDEAEAAPAPPAPAAPEARPASRACPPGTRRVATEDLFEPAKCVSAAEGPAPRLDARRFQHYEVPGELRFEYPQDWHVSDAWKDDVPSIYIEPGTRRDGKPVMLTISRYRAGASGYVDMEVAIRREMEWHGAKSGGKGDVAGLPARHLEIPGEGRLAYLRTADGYFLLSFSAPEDLFKAYLPAYARLLKSFRVVHDERDPMPDAER